MRRLLEFIGLIFVVFAIIVCVAINSLYKNTKNKVATAKNIITSEEVKNDDEYGYEQVQLYSDEYITVIFTDFDDLEGTGLTGPVAICLEIENKCNKTIDIDLKEASVNGYNVDMDWLFSRSGEISPNHKRICKFSFDTLLSGITEKKDIKKVEFKIEISDENYKVLKTTKNITLDVL